MTDTLSLALAQINPTVGDLPGNLARIRAARAEAARLGAELVVYPELVLSGYPPEDLVLKPDFQEAVAKAVEALAADTADGGPALLVGAPWVKDAKLYNAVLLLAGGKIAGLRFKHDLPNYGVFDEKRVFAAGPLAGADGVQRHPPGRDDLRRHVDPRQCRVPGGVGRRDPDRPQRLAL